jgi:hypothetical protein
MFGRKKKGPDKAFTHSDSCKIKKRDPNVEIQWSWVETGHWHAVCVCGEEHYYEPPAPRPRLDPLDPTTARHLPQCEFAGEAEPAMLRHALKVKPGMGEGYDWVECNACGGGWPVPHHAAERG